MKKKLTFVLRQLLLFAAVIVLVLLSLMFTLSAKGQPTDSATISYIEKYKALAFESQHRSGIPAAITLAQAIIESEAGGSKLAKMTNNHFGIKAWGDWKGEYVIHKDDNPKDRFRVYESIEASYRDHELFLTTRKPYKALFRIPVSNLKGWAYGLRDARYATDRKYPMKLLATIRKNRLDKLTEDEDLVTNDYF